MRSTLFLLFLAHGSCWEWDYPPLTGTPPLARAGHSASPFASASRALMVACGGQDPAGALLGGCDLLSPTASWRVSPVLTLPEVPTPRFDHASAVLGNYLVLFGGCKAPAGAGPPGAACTELLGDVEIYDTGVWKVINSTRMRPDGKLPRWGHTAVALGSASGGALASAAGSPCSDAAVTGCMVMYGGMAEGGGDVPDFAVEGSESVRVLVFKQTPEPSLSWAASEPLVSSAAGPLPPPRHYHASALLPSGGAMVVVGGVSAAQGGRLLSDVWQLDFSVFPWVWSERASVGLPPVHGHKLLATWSGWLLVFGGVTNVTTAEERGGTAGASGTLLLLASPSFSQAPNGTMNAWTVPPLTGDPPPTSRFRSSAVLMDVNADGEEELVVLGGEAGAGGSDGTTSQLCVLYGIGRTSPSAAQELPWVIAGCSGAVLVLVGLGYMAWKQELGRSGAALLQFRGKEGERSTLLPAESVELAITSSNWDYGGLEEADAEEAEAAAAAAAAAARRRVGGGGGADAVLAAARVTSLQQSKRYGKAARRGAAATPRGGGDGGEGSRGLSTPRRRSPSNYDKELEKALQLLGEGEEAAIAQGKE